MIQTLLAALLALPFAGMSSLCTALVSLRPQSKQNETSTMQLRSTWPGMEEIWPATCLICVSYHTWTDVAYERFLLTSAHVRYQA